MACARLVPPLCGPCGRNHRIHWLRFVWPQHATGKNVRDRVSAACTYTDTDAEYKC